jgi:hypothetical protein
VGRPGPDDYLVDCLPTEIARLAVPPIDLELAEVVASSAVREEIGKIVETGPPVFDRSLQDHLDRREQPAQLRIVDFPTRSPRVDAGKEQSLVRIDITQPGYRPLIEKERLDRSGALREC